VVKLRDLERATSIMVTHQLRDAFYVATHAARRDTAGAVEIVEATEAKMEEADFIMIREGQVAFEGNALELRHTQDPYLKAFLS